MKSMQKWKLGVALVCILGASLAACMPTSAPNTSILPSCAPKENVYIFKNIPSVLSIYQSALIPNQNPATYSGNLTNAQIQALLLLRDEVQRWSSFNDISVSKSQAARITLTHISPELVQVIILNQYLSNPVAVSQEAFKGVLTEEMKQISQRDEFFFLVTLTASEYDPNATSDNMLVLDIPVKEMILVNSSDLRVSPSHDDHPIDQEIILSRGNLSGYIAYPMAVQVNDSCIQVLESLWNTTVTIGLSKLLINGTQYEHQLTWFIKYHSLVDLGAAPGLPIPNIQPGFDLNHLSPTTVPPSPDENRSSTDIAYWDGYWEDMARYIWAYVIDP